MKPKPTIDTREVPDHLWATSPYTGEDNCVEYAVYGGARVVRDSKARKKPGLVFTHDQWSKFCREIKAGDHDL